MTEQEKLLVLEIKNDISAEGCEWGRQNRRDLGTMLNNINGMGKKIGRLYGIGWAILITLIGSLFTLVGVLMLYASKLK